MCFSKSCFSQDKIWATRHTQFGVTLLWFTTQLSTRPKWRKVYFMPSEQYTQSYYNESPLNTHMGIQCTKQMHMCSYIMLYTHSDSDKHHRLRQNSLILSSGGKKYFDLWYLLSSSNCENDIECTLTLITRHLLEKGNGHGAATCTYM